VSDLPPTLSHQLQRPRKFLPHATEKLLLCWPELLLCWPELLLRWPELLLCRAL
jgi:hypothetical protein